jgi:hypothetical protein
MNIRQELKYAQRMLERRLDEASTIGKAESLRQARETHRSMMTCVREVKRHRDNILSAIEDSNALEASQAMSLLVTATEWLSRAGNDLRRFGVTQDEIDKIINDVYGMEGVSQWG